MALVTWEIDCEVEDAGVVESDSPEDQAVKYAHAIAETYFGGEMIWSFIVELNSGQLFNVNLETGEVEDVSDDQEEAEDLSQSLN